jgi:hypothetical protein
MRTVDVLKFRYPNKAFVVATNSGHKGKNPRWYTIYENNKGRFVTFRGRRVYESEWRYPNATRRDIEPVSTNNCNGY